MSRSSKVALVEILLALSLAVGVGLLVGSVLSTAAGVGSALIVFALVGFVFVLAVGSRAVTDAGKPAPSSR